MRRLACCSVLCAAVLAGCARSDDRTATDTAAAALDTSTMAAPGTTAAGTTISLANVAGRWNVRLMPETGDSTLATYVLTATGDTSGWTFTFPNRPPQPVRIIAVEGDSIVSEAGPFESILRRGVPTTSRSVTRLQGDRMVGTTTVRYATSGPDSVRRFRVEGTRAP